VKKKEIEGVVVKVLEHSIVMLSHDGTFTNIPRSTEQVPRMGEHFTYIERDKRRKSSWLAYVSIASVFLLGILLYTTLQSSELEASYVVTMDINPSIEMYVDQDNNVVNIIALNQEAEKIIEGLRSKRIGLSQILDEILTRSIKEGYLSDINYGVITTSVVSLLESDKEIEGTVKNIQYYMEQSLADKDIEAKVSVTNDNREVFEEAHQMKLSINKFKLYQRFINEDITITFEDISNNSIARLLEQEKEQRNQLNQLKQQQSDKKTKKPFSSYEESITPEAKQNTKQDAPLPEVPKASNSKPLEDRKKAQEEKAQGKKDQEEKEQEEKAQEGKEKGNKAQKDAEQDQNENVNKEQEKTQDGESDQEVNDSTTQQQESPEQEQEGQQENQEPTTEEGQGNVPVDKPSGNPGARP
jgi:hypothetical protein